MTGCRARGEVVKRAGVPGLRKGIRAFDSRPISHAPRAPQTGRNGREGREPQESWSVSRRSTHHHVFKTSEAPPATQRFTLRRRWQRAGEAGAPAKAGADARSVRRWGIRAATRVPPLVPEVLGLRIEAPLSATGVGRGLPSAVRFAPGEIRSRPNPRSWWRRLWRGRIPGEHRPGRSPCVGAQALARKPRQEARSAA